MRVELDRCESLAARGQLKQALALIEQLRAQYPDAAPVMALQGRLELATGQAGSAVHWLQQAQALDDQIATRFSLGCALAQSGALRPAREQLRYCCQQQPTAEHLAVLGNCERLLGHWPAAQATLERALQSDPAHLGAQMNLALCLLDAHKFAQAERMFTRLLAFRPAPEIYKGLLQSLMGQARLPQAAELLAQALARHPNNGTLLQCAGALAVRTGDEALARHYYEQACAAEPKDPTNLINLGVLSEQAGDLKGATAFWQRALALAPANSQLLLHIGLLPATHRSTSDDEALAQWLTGHSEHPDWGRLQLVRAQQLEATDPKAAAQGLIQAHQRLAEHRPAAKPWLADTLSNPPALTALSEAPVLLVIGLPRSGTTLVDQILAAHSAVRAQGEGLLGQSLARAVSNSQPTADILASLEAESGLLLDTSPGTAEWLGWVLALLPNARIVWCRRSPIDHAIALLRQPLSQAHSYVHRPEDLAGTWLAHEKLIKHWMDRYPGRITPVHYEALVQNPERVIHTLLTALELTPEAACFAPHQLQRSIRTPSASAVRKPISAPAPGRYQHYRAAMPELVALLAGAEQNYFTDCAAAVQAAG